MTSRAIGYIRVSTADQADNGISLEAQDDRIRGWCGVNGYHLDCVKVDRGLSGGRADNRPALQEALQLVRRGDALIVYSLSRLARSTKDTLAIAETLDRRGADLVSLSEKIDTTSATGKMLFRLLAVLSEFERDVIAERTSLAMRHLQSLDRFIGGDAPYGYTVEGDMVVPLPREQRVVQLAQELRSSGLSLRVISARLADRGFLSRTDLPFLPGQVSRMLKRRGGR